MKAKINSEKTNLHPRNSHRFGYDFTLLMESCPELKPFVFINAYQNQTIDFSNADAVKILNKALLIKDYGIENWDIPANYLCSPIPGRADYIHYVADLLASTNKDVIPRGETVQGLDIGIGSNAIYPLLGNALYDWSFVGTDIDEKALQNCKQIISNNPKLMMLLVYNCKLKHVSFSKTLLLPKICLPLRYVIRLFMPPRRKPIKPIFVK